MALKTRLIPIILFAGYTSVTTIQFGRHRNAGSPVANVKLYSRQKVDELIFIDINASKENRGPLFQVIEDIVDESQMPLTVGGGIRTVEDIEKLLHIGADKVCIGTAAIENDDLIANASKTFGRQCIVVALDVKKGADNHYEVVTNGGQKYTGKEPVKTSRQVTDLGAGEILLTSIDNQGLMNGYDLCLANKVGRELNVPLIINGGAGEYQHFVEAIVNGHASAIAASTMFQYTQKSPIEGRKYLKDKGINVR